MSHDRLLYTRHQCSSWSRESSFVAPTSQQLIVEFRYFRIVSVGTPTHPPRKKVKHYSMKDTQYCACMMSWQSWHCLHWQHLLWLCNRGPHQVQHCGNNLQSQQNSPHYLNDNELDVYFYFIRNVEGERIWLCQYPKLWNMCAWK